MIHVEEVREATDELVDALARLVPQLSRSRPPPTFEQTAEIVTTRGMTLFLARDAAGTIVGTLTLVVFRIPTGVRARIEDVVVDEAGRGKGAGEALTREAIEHARRAAADFVELSSHPSREAANRLYRRLGFQLRETNVYRYAL